VLIEISARAKSGSLEVLTLRAVVLRNIYITHVCVSVFVCTFYVIKLQLLLYVCCILSLFKLFLLSEWILHFGMFLINSS
jgi:hypothetical protein